MPRCGWCTCSGYILSRQVSSPRLLIKMKSRKAQEPVSAKEVAYELSEGPAAAVLTGPVDNTGAVTVCTGPR